MSTQPFGAPLVRFLDSNAAPLSGGKLYTYVGGTSTPQATYTDASGTVANTNPVVLDSTGSAQVWLTPNVNYKFVLTDSSGVQQWSVDNYPAPTASTSTSTFALGTEPGGRLTLSPSLSVPTTDVTAALTVWYLAYKNSEVPLYDGSNWALYSIPSGLNSPLSDTTYSPAAAVASSCYDLFLWYNGSAVILSRGPAWTSDTARGSGAGTTQLTQVNGRWSNAQAITNGPAAFRGLYVGTIRTDSSVKANDSLAKRHVWNNYNRVSRPMLTQDGTAAWTYTSSAWLQANNNAANQLDFVVGLSEDDVYAEVHQNASNSGTTAQFLVAIGLDALSPTGLYAPVMSGSANQLVLLRAEYRGFPGIGRHFLAWLQSSTAFGVTTWNGTASQVSNGIQGTIRG